MRKALIDKGYRQCKLCRYHSLQPERILVPKREQGGQLGIVKRKTDTPGAL